MRPRMKDDDWERKPDRSGRTRSVSLSCHRGHIVTPAPENLFDTSLTCLLFSAEINVAISSSVKLDGYGIASEHSTA